jgi:hypothetical protein
LLHQAYRSKFNQSVELTRKMKDNVQLSIGGCTI